MSHKEYVSTQYYAQRVRDGLLRQLMKQCGGSVRIKHSGSSLDFPLVGVQTHVDFEDVEGVTSMKVHMELVNGDGKIRTDSYAERLDIERSKTGRMSDDYSTKLAKFIIGKDKEFYKQWCGSK